MIDRKKKIIILILVCIIGLSVGFALFNSTLTISSTASVNPNSTFSILFSDSNNISEYSISGVSTNNVIGVSNDEDISVNEGIISNSTMPTISNIGGTMTDIGQTITYTFYVVNISDYDAYLTDIIFNNVEGESSFKSCVASDSTMQSEVDDICNSMSVKVEIGEDNKVSAINVSSSINNHLLSKKSLEKVVVTLSYNGSTTPSSAFNVSFGDISMSYNLVDNDVTEEEEEEDSCYYTYNVYEDTSVSTYDINLDECKSIMINKQNADESTATTMCSGSVDDLVTTVLTNMDLDTSSEFYRNYVLHQLIAYEAVIETNSSNILGKTIASYECDDTDVSIPSKIGEYDVIEIGTSVFNDKGLTNVEIPNTVTKIGFLSFYGNQLTSIEIPDSVISIDDYAFSANQLTSLTIPDSVVSIGGSTFASNQLTSLTLGNNVSEIGSGAFVDNKLTNLIIPDGVTSIGYGAFYTNQITSLTLGSNVSEIGSYSFYSNQLTSVEIPENVTSIGDYAFSANQITSLTISNGVTSIGNYAFYKNKLTSVSIPNSVTSIGNYAFRYNNLTNLTIGSGITSIGNYAFYSKTTSEYGPNELTSVTINRNQSDVTLGNSAFGWASGYSDDNIVWNG